MITLLARVLRALPVLLAFLAPPLVASAAAQQGGAVDGHISLLFDTLPDVDRAPGRQTTSEARVRLFVERRQALGDHVRLHLSGYLDGLLASRAAPGVLSPGGPVAGGAAVGGVAVGGATGASSVIRDVIVRPADLYVEFTTSRFDIRAGASRLAWGRLDEFQPTDVVNPIDLSRFLLEGRAEARLAVGLVRTRIFLPGMTTLEAVVVPGFRAGRFDQLDEGTSPFNLSPSPGLRSRRVKPAFGRESVQGGVRATSTIGRVDVGASAYRGLRGFPVVTLENPPLVAPPLSSLSGPASGQGAIPGGIPPPQVAVESFPRFTMIGADFETVRGLWGLRGEVAAFVDDELQSTRAARGVPGSSIEGGLGVDRRAGEFRVALNVLVSRRSPDRADAVGARFIGDDEIHRTDTALVAAVDRSFVNETRTLRVFTVYDPVDRTVFARAIGAVSVRDNVWIEGSGGLFAGSSFDTIGPLTNRDFVYARLRVFF